MSNEPIAAVPEGHPLKIAWDAYQQTDDFENTRRWAGFVEHPHLQGSLWECFRMGFEAGLKAAQRPEAERQSSRLRGSPLDEDGAIRFDKQPAEPNHQPNKRSRT